MDDQAELKVTEGPGSFLSDILEQIHFKMGFMQILCGRYICVHGISLSIFLYV